MKRKRGYLFLIVEITSTQYSVAGPVPRGRPRCVRKSGSGLALPCHSACHRTVEQCLIRFQSRLVEARAQKRSIAVRLARLERRGPVRARKPFRASPCRRKGYSADRRNYLERNTLDAR